MTNASKKMVIGSMAVAGLVGIAAILDMVLKVPFAGSIVMDIMFIVSAALVIFMGYDSYRELS